MLGKLASTAFFALALVACSDSCEELEEQCGNCPGSDDASDLVEMACRAVVDHDDDEVCEEALDSAGFDCP